MGKEAENGRVQNEKKKVWEENKTAENGSQGMLKMDHREWQLFISLRRH